MTEARDLKQPICEQARAVGFDVVGFAPPELGEVTRARLQAYLAEGYHGSMGWMEEKADRRGNPQILWPEVRSIIMLGMSYAPEHDPMETLKDGERATVSVYAQNRDYHDVVKKKLKELARWIIKEFGGDIKVFVDTAPVMEKPLAELAGIGWQGKSSVVISRTHGAWLFLGAIYTTLEIPPDAAHRNHCGSCTRCLDVCSTQAFVAPYVLDARKCISYLTIEHKGPIERDLRPLMGNRIYGCDDCLAVCPWNSFAQAARRMEFMPREVLTAPKLAELAHLDEAGFRAMFSGSPVKRIGRDRFVRNVLIALGNSGNAAHAAVAEVLLADASPLVRGAAVWCLAQLRSAVDFTRLRAVWLAREEDEDVRAEWACAS